MKVLNGFNSTVFIDDKPLVTDWTTATSDQIFKQVNKMIEHLRKETGQTATHCNTPFGCFFLRPVPRVIKVKKGPGKRRTVPVYFVRVGK